MDMMFKNELESDSVYLDNMNSKNIILHRKTYLIMAEEGFSM